MDMLIGIDGNEANIQNRVGVNKYAYEIIRGIYDLIYKSADPSKQLIVYVYLKSKPLADMPKETDWFKYKILNGGGKWILTKLTPHLISTRDKPDVFFFPSHYISPFLKIPVVCAIMDLGYIEFSAQFKKKDFWQLKYWSAISIKRSKYILTISNASAKDIVRLYPDSKNKVVVSHPGYDKYLTTSKISANSIAKVKQKYSIVNNYVLYIGTLKPSKNIEGLLLAFSEVKKNYKDIKLVIGGKKGWLYESIFKEVKELGLVSDVVFTDFVDERDKAALIKGSRVFVLPSFWEGFGLDVLTAYALEIPVVASNVGSLPEVVGDAGLLVNPKDTNSIAQGISKVLSMPKTDYNRLVSKEKKQLSKFSWEEASKITLETLRKAANVH
jgi:glycosyltransferase involved in cell wall biosynthesis